MKKIIKSLFTKSIIFDSIFIFSLSLVTLNWTGSKEIIDGNDTSYPLKPIEYFQERLYQWRHNFGSGLEFSYGSAGLTWHGFQALIAATGVNIYTNQKIFILFWFNAISFSFYFLSATLLPHRKQRLACLAGTVFYSFNPYLFNLWSNIQSANLAAYAFIPFATGCLIRAFSSKNFIWWLILTAEFSFLCSAMGGNPQVIFVVAFYFCLLFFFIFLDQVIKLKKIALKTFLKIAVLFCFFIFLLNSFWIVPEFRAVTSGNLSLVIPSKEKLRGWLDSLSLNTSALNVIKMQGEWTWYDKYRGEPYVPFAATFKSNPILIIVSFLAFFLSSLAIYKSKLKWTPFYGLTLFLGLLFSIGTKAPFGYLYLFLTEKIKFLSFLRSPWYKFSLLTAISYSVLVAFSVSWFLTKKNNLRKIWVFLIIVGQLIYSYPLITGEVVSKNFKILPPYKFSIPDYVWEADQWLKRDTEESRIVVTPKQTERDFYLWGYGAPIQIGNLLANPKSFLNGSEWGVIEAADANRLVDSFYKYLYQTSSKVVARILSPLNVKYLLQKNDYDYSFSGSAGSPAFIEKKIAQQKYLNLVSKIGKWDIYELDKELRLPLIYGTNRLNVFRGEINSLADLFLLNDDVYTVSILESDLISKGISFLGVDNIKNQFYLSGYLLETNPNFWPLTPFARFSPKHPFYSYSIWKEENVLRTAKSLGEKILLGLFYGGKRVEEAEILYFEGLTIPGNDLILGRLIQDYSAKIRTVKDNFNQILKPIFNKQLVELLQNIYLSLQVHRSKLIKIFYAIPDSKTNLKEFVYQTIEENLSFEQELSNIIKNKVSSPTEKRFQVNLSQDGEYELYLMAEDLKEIALDQFALRLKINGVQYETKKNFLNNDWVYLGNFFLDSGEKEIEIIFPEPENVLANIDLANWQNQGKVKIGKEENSEILILEADKSSASSSIILDNLDLGRSYTLSFQYRNFSQNLPHLVISSPSDSLDYNGKITHKRDGELDNFSTWKEKTVLLEPDNNLGKVKITFRLDKPPVWRERGLTEIKEIKLFQDRTPSLIMKKINDLPSRNGNEPFQAAHVSFTKINPTEYLVDLKDVRENFVLVFLESYHPLWQAFLKDENGKWQPLDQKDHLKVNGYANGWVIRRLGSYQIILRYLPQKEYHFLLIISGLSFFVGLVYLGLKLLIKKDDQTI